MVALKDEAHYSNFGKHVGFEAKSRGITDERQIEAIAIRVLQQYAKRSALTWRTQAQQELTTIAREALVFSQQLPEQQNEIDMTKVEEKVQEKIVKNRQYFMQTVFSQFRLNNLENSAESITTLAFEELCHQLRLPMELLISY